MTRTRGIALLVINVVLAAGAMIVAIHPRNPSDRLVGICVAVFFGGSVALLSLNAVMNRGLRVMPSAPLRIDARGTKTLDRLVIHASPQRVLWVAGSAIVFFAAGAIVPAVEPNVVGVVIGIPGMGLGVLLVVMAIVTARPPNPLMTFDLESVRYQSPLQPLMIVPYEEISSVTVVQHASQRFVTIGARDPGAVLARTTDKRARRRVISTLRTLGAPWVLPVASAMSAEQLCDLLFVYLEAYRSRSPIGGTRTALPIERAHPM